MKVVGYVRVSTEEQANSGLSLAAQEEKIRQYAKLYDLEVVEIIRDAGESGKDLKRPGVNEALQALGLDGVEGLVVAKLDRLTRSIKDLNYLIENYFDRHILLSVSDQVDTRSASGRLVLNILMSVAQWEREAIGERTKAALAEKRRQGFKLGRPEKKMTDNEKMFYEHAYRLRGDGMSLDEIARIMTLHAYPTPNGGRWHGKSVANLLARGARE